MKFSITKKVKLVFFFVANASVDLSFFLFLCFGKEKKLDLRYLKSSTLNPRLEINTHLSIYDIH